MPNKEYAVSDTEFLHATALLVLELQHSVRRHNDARRELAWQVGYHEHRVPTNVCNTRSCCWVGNKYLGQAFGARQKQITLPYISANEG